MLSANQINEIKEQAFIGVPSVLPDVCKIYPYTLKEIISMGTFNYNKDLSLLTLTEQDILNIINSKLQGQQQIQEIDVLEYLIKSASFNNTFLLELQNAFATFVKEDILVLSKINAILVGPPAEKRMITKENFSDFQNILRIQNKKAIKEPPPENESAWEKKMRLNRERVAEAKRKKAKKEGTEQTLLDQLEIAMTYGIDIDKCTLFAFYRLLQRHQMKEKWQQDLQMICAGADSTKLKTQYWGESSSEK